MSARPTRAQAIANAGRVLAAGYAAADAMTPGELARAAWHPSCGMTRSELENRIRADRGLPPLDATA